MSEKELQDLKQCLKSLSEGQQEIIDCLKGDKFGNPGAVERLIKCERKLTHHANMIDRIYWTSGTIALIISLLFAIININL